MNLRNCSRCGKMFNYVQGPNICDQCKKAIEEEFQNVKKYIMENPCAGIPEIIKECNVTQKQIQQWVREERLEFSKDSPIKLTCEKCGATILTGRFCSNCKEKMADNLSDTVAKKKSLMQQVAAKSDPKSGMRFLDV